MTKHADEVRGRVLEVGEDSYTRRFGGTRVDRVDVLHVDAGNSAATIVADLTGAPNIPDDTFDCVICLQTLLLIWDVPAAVETIHRVLAPGGVALVTVPGITRVNRAEADQWGDWWRFTAQSARRLFEDSFGEGAVDVEAYGNVLAATAQLYGIAAEELRAEELAHRDRDYEVVLGVRAVKA
jgi:SAM-dependent methyltransferase